MCGKRAWKAPILSVLLAVLFLHCARLLAEARPEYVCYSVRAESLKLDGRLDEPFWAQTPWVQLADMATGKSATYSCRAKFVWDNDALYAAYQVDCPHVFGKDAALGTTPEDFQKNWKEIEQLMFVKLFLDPDADGNDVFEIHIHPANWMMHFRMQIPNNNQNLGASIGTSWEAEGLKSAVVVDGTLNDDSDIDRGMSVELAIPWSAITKFAQGGAPPKPGARWAFSPQFRYLLQPGKEVKREARYASWPRMGIVDSHIYDKYAYLVFSEKRPRTLQWKMVWAWDLPCKSEAQIEEGVLKAKTLGFNAMVWEVPNWIAFVHACRKHGLEPYATIALSLGKQIYRTQRLLGAEEKLPFDAKAKPDYQYGGEPVEGSPGKEIHWMDFPCFRHPNVVEQYKVLIRRAIDRGYAGIALDFIGYKNYHGCYCELCQRLMQQNAAPNMSAQETINRFNEETLVSLNTELCEYAKDYAASLRRSIKTTAHIYPVFMPNPLYANRIPLDYCGQTVAWFFRPHWSAEKVERYTRYVVEREAACHRESIGAPFVAFYSLREMAEHAKAPELMRRDIQLIKRCGARAIQFAELGNILAAPEVAKVVAEELRDEQE